MIYSLETKGKDQVTTEKDQVITGKHQVITEKDQVITGKDKELAAKDVVLAFTRDKLADANLRYLIALGDISIRGVVESLEKDSIYLETKLHLRKSASSDNEYPDSRRLVWQAILNHPEKSSRFHNLKKLAIEENINVVESLVSLHRTSSKGIHSAKFDEVLIDLDSLSRNEVSC